MTLRAKILNTTDLPNGNYVHESVVQALYARIRALPSPVVISKSADSLWAVEFTCEWCGCVFRNNVSAPDRDSQHPPNGCLWPEAHASEQERGT